MYERETNSLQQLDGFLASHPSDSTRPTPFLRQLVCTAKQEMGVETVYAWHALHGHWRGVSQGLARRLSLPWVGTQASPPPHLLKMEPRLASDPITLFGAGLVVGEGGGGDGGAERLYGALHGSLAVAGVNGVVVDAHSALCTLGEGLGGGALLAQRYTRAMEASVGTYFGAECINSMSHSSDSLLQFAGTSVARAAGNSHSLHPELHARHLLDAACEPPCTPHDSRYLPRV